MESERLDADHYSRRELIGIGASGRKGFNDAAEFPGPLAIQTLPFEVESFNMIYTLLCRGSPRILIFWKASYIISSSTWGAVLRGCIYFEGWYCPKPVLSGVQFAYSMIDYNSARLYETESRSLEESPNSFNQEKKNMYHLEKLASFFFALIEYSEA